MSDETKIISIATAVWEKRLAAYMVATQKSVLQALSEEWPLLIRKIIDFTPPFKAGGAPGASDLSVGRAAVARDIEKVMRPFDPADIRSKSLRRIIETKDIPAFNAVAQRARSGLMNGARAIAFSPSAHTRARNQRGRVPGLGQNQVVLGTDAALLKNYVTNVQSRVGFAKSGWAKAYNLVADPEGRMLPSYVTRQGTAGGDVIDDRQNADSPSLTAINRTPWASRYGEGERIKSSAFASRANALKSKVATALRLARKQAELNGREVAA
jgi:hypothetical protein